MSMCPVTHKLMLLTGGKLAISQFSQKSLLRVWPESCLPTHTQTHTKTHTHSQLLSSDLPHPPIESENAYVFFFESALFFTFPPFSLSLFPLVFCILTPTPQPKLSLIWQLRCADTWQRRNGVKCETRQEWYWDKERITGWSGGRSLI